MLRFFEFVNICFGIQGGKWDCAKFQDHMKSYAIAYIEGDITPENKRILASHGYVRVILHNHSILSFPGTRRNRDPPDRHPADKLTMILHSSPIHRTE